MNFAVVKRELKRDYRMSLTRLDDGEFRTTYSEWDHTRRGENAAYYSNDLDDVLCTARIMRATKNIRDVRLSNKRKKTR